MHCVCLQLGIKAPRKRRSDAGASAITDAELELIALFKEQAEEVLLALQTAYESEDEAGWKSSAHRFKGASGNLGAIRLSHLCKTAESHFTDEKSLKEKMLADIHGEYARVVKALDELWPS